MLRTIGLHMFLRDAMAEAMGGAGAEGIDTIWSGYNFILGFLIVFRSTMAKNVHRHSARPQRSRSFDQLIYDGLYSFVLYSISGKEPTASYGLL